MPMIEAAPIGDIFITVTGCKDVIRKQHFEVMKDKAIMCNAGHFDCEVNGVELAEVAVSHKNVRKNIEGYSLADGRTLYLLAGGVLLTSPPEMVILRKSWTCPLLCRHWLRNTCLTMVKIWKQRFIFCRMNWMFVLLKLNCQNNGHTI